MGWTISFFKETQEEREKKEDVVNRSLKMAHLIRF